MKRALFLNSFIALIMMISGFTLVTGETSTGTYMDDMTVHEIQEPITPEFESEFAPEDEDYVLLDDLIDSGHATEWVMDYDNIPTTVGWFGPRTMSPPTSPGATKDENDGPGNATEMTDGSTYEDNVTSWMDSTSIYLSDTDWFYFNLTVDTNLNTADRITIDISSPDADEKNAPVIAEFGTYFTGSLFGVNAAFDTMDFEMTGGTDRNTSTIEATVEATGTYYLQIYTWNHTTVNYTIEASISTVSVSNPEWNAIWPGGTFVNSTILPSRMQVADQANDTWDWFSLSPLIDDHGLDTARGDSIRLGFRIDEATAYKGKQNAYMQPTMYDTIADTCAITWVWVVYNNYEEFANGQPSLHLVMLSQQQGLPFFISSVFGTGTGAAISQNIVFEDKIDAAWIGVNPVQLWYNQNYNMFGCDDGAHVQYNITNLNVDLLPPNDAPILSDPIDDQEFDEDMGPWNVTDLLEHFSDTDTITPLEFVITKPSGVTNPDELEIKIVSGRYLWVNVTEEHWHGEGEYKIRCLDWGVLDPTISVDDREVMSNAFIITIDPINDPAYIEKVETGAGSVVNEHEPIEISIPQGSPVFRSKKVFGRDHDTEDQNKLVYTHNSTTPRFQLNQNGQMDFVPNNDDVGTIFIRIWVDDQKGDAEDDYVDLKFIIQNRNDKPELTRIEWSDGARSFDLTQEDTPTFKNVREDFEINLTVTASDPDIEIGQPESLAWTVGANGWNVFNHPTDPSKAYVTYTPTNEDAVYAMVETTLFCMDTSNSMSNEIKIRLMIDNVNDAPEILTVNNEVPVKQGVLKKVVFTEETGIYGLEDDLFTISISALDIDPRDSIIFRSSDPSFQFYPDAMDEFTGNFTMRPTQEMVGIHTVIFTVTDEDGDTDSVTVEYEIVNTNDAPTGFTVDWDTSVDLLTGNNITFFVEDMEDPDGDDLTVFWDFGDNTEIVEGDTVSHFFANDQSYIITVTIKDPSGSKLVKTKTITIYPQVIPEPDPDLDTDGDGIPDIWEDENGLNKLVPDATLDPDKDGFTNFEEYQANTSPINENDHPIKEVSSDAGFDPIWIALIVMAFIVLAAVAFFIFAFMRNPKPVQQQQMYASESGLPPGQGQQQLPGQVPMGLPPGPAQEEVGSGQVSPDLPPAEEPMKEEEQLPESFLEDAAAAIKDESTPLEGEDNIWRPPVEEGASHESQIDDLFADAPDDEPVVDAGEAEDSSAATEGPPAPPKMSDLPPPPPPEP